MDPRWIVRRTLVLHGDDLFPCLDPAPYANDGNRSRKELVVMTAATYPVHVDARLDTEISRGLWLVKWLLALPHCLVLAFLWVAFAVLSVIAFFAILLTGRYPRAIFDFNVGVLRWHWRVAYYAYGALGTDRYPPFTLRDVEDYPAHLEVDYPEHLSRGLVLVKWWLLALPHYLIVALLVGGTGIYFGTAGDQGGLWTAGLIPLLVLVAGVIVLFTGGYPRPLFDLILGLNRWVLRVAGYAALMTDAYPPFQLDQGGHADGAAAAVDVVPAGASPPDSPPTSQPDGPPPATPHPAAPLGWSTGRIVSLVLGCLVALGSVGLVLGGLSLVVVDQTSRDDNGFLMTPAQTFTSATYAIASADIEMHADAPVDLTPASLLGDAKLTATAADGGEVFIGVATAGHARAYLADIEHQTVARIVDGEAQMRTSPGGAPTSRPAAADLWVVQSSGAGTQTVTWPPENGDWVVVVMNQDATRGVDVSMTAGAEVPVLSWVIGLLLTLGATGLAVAAILIAVPLRAVGRGAARR